MKRILFVDDEPGLHEGLLRALQPHRDYWDVMFAKGGEIALRMLEAHPFDVIVTDMPMPGMDGAQLLERVRDRFPGLVRIVLSGHCAMESALRTVPVAHQFLQSPCDVPQLLAAIERAGSVTAALPDATIRRIVGAVGELPCLPRTAAALMRALEDPEVPVSRLAGIVEQDIAISAKVMQLVNSAFFGRSQRVTTIPHAVTLLGIDVLKQLVITAEIFRAFRPQRFIRGYRLDCIQEHSHVVAAIAAHLPLPGTAIPVAAVAALLHDAGKLIMASRLPLECERVGRLTTAGAISFHAAEARVMGTTHAEIGAYLLALWGLPAEIVDAVARHHRPAVEPGEALLFGAPAAVYFANCLAHERDLASPASASHTAPAIDLDYLRAVEMEDEIVGWRAMAETAGRP